MTERHIRTRVTFVSTEDGGRHSPVRNGYKPGFAYPGDTSNQAIIYVELVGASEAWPGDSVIADIQFLRPECHVERLVVGCAFDPLEGGRLIARGVVMERLGIKI